MAKVHIRPQDLAKIHRTQPLNEYGPCQVEFCMCHEFTENPGMEDICGNCHHHRQEHEHPWHT